VSYYLSTPYCFDPDSPQLRAVLTNPPVREVGTAAFVADLPFFRRVLEDACAGYGRLLRNPEYNADAFFADWRDSILAAGGTISVRSAASGPMNELQRLAPSRHLVIVGAGPSGQPSPGGHPYSWRIVDNTAVIRLTTFQAFDAEIAPQLDRFVADYPSHKECERVVFDLRGNKGGSTTYVRDWIARARAGEWQTYGYVEVYGRIACCSMWNPVVEWQVRNGTVDSREAIADRSKLSAEWPTLGDAPPTRTNEGHYPGQGTDPYDGRVFVLVDRHSGSSGERAAIDLQRALGAVLVGEPTAGAMQYTEARRFIFPETGVQCIVPIKRQEFGREVEGIGWPVDITLNADDLACDAVELLPLLR
jgi:hypothetical protein